MRAYRPSFVDGTVEECAEEFIPPDREATLAAYAKRVEAGQPLFEVAAQATIIPKRDTLSTGVGEGRGDQPSERGSAERTGAMGLLLLVPWFPGDWSGAPLAEMDAKGLESREVMGR